MSKIADRSVMMRTEDKEFFVAFCKDCKVGSFCKLALEPDWLAF